jgi:hypothetical protein
VLFEGLRVGASANDCDAVGRGWMLVDEPLGQEEPALQPFHSNVVRPPRPVKGGVPGPKYPAGKEASISHWPVSTSRRSSQAGRSAGMSPGLSDPGWAVPCGSPCWSPVASSGRDAYS